MKGYVPTPPAVATTMVTKLFQHSQPTPEDTILFPGAGTGPFITAVKTYCDDNNIEYPSLVAIELDAGRAASCRDNHPDPSVTVHEQNFLTTPPPQQTFEYIIGNPPYVSIEHLTEPDKQEYKHTFSTATGRFDLYMLFFERAVQLLADTGRLVFITPEKYEYVNSASTLRELLTTHHIEEIHHLPEDTFDDYLAYPAVTTLNKNSNETTRVTLRDDSTHETILPQSGDSWASNIRLPDTALITSDITLKDICDRISCGVATGADKQFVHDIDTVPTELSQYTFPTVSGRELESETSLYTGSVFISPYDEQGEVRDLDAEQPLKQWLLDRQDALEDRSCVRNGKHWTEWHENPPMTDMRQQKIVCKDVTATPEFWIDTQGDLIPRHSVYYIIPNANIDLEALVEYLNSSQAQHWLEANAPKASNDYLRLQSTVLKQLPIPETLSNETTLSE